MTSDVYVSADERARMHDAVNRDRFAIRRNLRAMSAELKRLERKAHDFDVHEQQTKDAIEEIWLVECWGQAPMRAPAWQTSMVDDDREAGSERSSDRRGRSRR